MMIFSVLIFSLSFVRPYPYQRPSPGYDVLHYDINLKINPSTRRIKGYVEFVTVVTHAYLNDVIFNSIDLNIDSVLVLNKKISSFQYPDSDLVKFHLPYRVFKKETLNFKVFFNKFYPPNYSIDNMRGVFFHPEGMIFTFSEPQDARRWFPCWDEPYDKATLRIKFNVPYGYEVASNGLLMQRVEYPQHDSTVFIFYESHPIATYLIAFSAYTDYQIVYDFYQDKALYYYTINNLNRIVAEKLRTMHRKAIEFFSRKFVNYPFSKYGVASVFDFPGGMENQTITFVNPGWWNDTLNIYKFEYGFIHELAHQWFGDFVTPSDWKEIWLNEGFASYCEILWAEYKYGKEEAISRLKEFKNSFFTLDSTRLYPIYDPRDAYFSSVFIPIIYKKGAYVLHMLRKLIGDTSFFNALRDYLESHSYGNVTVNDFMNSCEKYYGNSLFFFFNEWLTRKDYPIFRIYDTTYSAGENLYVNEIRIKQRFPPYILPMKIALYFKGSSSYKDLWIDDTFKVYKIYTLYVPDSIVYDPDDDLLCKIIKEPVIARKENLKNIYVYNSDRNILINFEIDKKTEIEIKIYDSSGRRVRELIKDFFGPGKHEILWTGKSSSGNYVGSGNYFLIFKAGEKKIVRKFLLVK